MPFDQILFEPESGAPRLVTVEEFQSVTLHERMQAVLDKRVHFSSNGSPVLMRIALRALYRA